MGDFEGFTRDVPFLQRPLRGQLAAGGNQQQLSGHNSYNMRDKALPTLFVISACASCRPSAGSADEAVEGQRKASTQEPSTYQHTRCQGWMLVSACFSFAAVCMRLTSAHILTAVMMQVRSYSQPPAGGGRSAFNCIHACWPVCMPASSALPCVSTLRLVCTAGVELLHLLTW